MNDRCASIQISASEQMGAYVARPDRPNGHAIIVLQEIFGVTSAVRGVADRFANDGYLALAPDLFWRIAPGIQLSHSKEDLAKAFNYVGRFDETAAIGDIGAAVKHLRGALGAEAEISVVGLCLGGKLAYLSAAKLDLHCAVSFYGVGIEKSLDLASGLKCPLLMHFGGLDKYVPPEAREKIAAALPHDGQNDMHVYPDADHGFYTRGDARTIQEAHERTLHFLTRD
jgi:carboxymethylenebutenolidase